LGKTAGRLHSGLCRHFDTSSWAGKIAFSGGKNLVWPKPDTIKEGLMKTYTNLFKIIAIGAVIAAALASCGGEVDYGRVADYAAAYENEGGKRGPWSDVVSVIIA
jgi:hypothetical protein